MYNVITITYKLSPDNPAIAKDGQDINKAMNVAIKIPRDVTVAKEAAADKPILRSFIIRPPMNAPMAPDPMAMRPAFKL